MGDVTEHLLTVDRGNSTLDCYDHGVGQRTTFSVAALDSTEIAAYVARVLPARCVAVTVVPGGLAELELALAAHGTLLQVVGRELRCPLRLEYATPHTLGADRWLGAFAAHHRFGRSVVVDCGSATTVNLVEADATFCGGAIAPGLGALVAALRITAPALPAAHVDAVPSMPPQSSQAAVDTGVLLGYCGLVERLVADSMRVARGPVQLVITGGNARRLKAHTRLRGLWIDDLVHQGLRLLAHASPCSS